MKTPLKDVSKGVDVIGYKQKQYADMSKDTRKLLRLLTKEKYIVKRVCDCFEVLTRDLRIRAFVSIQGITFDTNDDEYSKIDYYKLNNFSDLLFGVKEENSQNFLRPFPIIPKRF